MTGAVRDYWLNKLFFDLQSPEAAAEYRSNRDRVLDRYPGLDANVRSAVAREDVAVLAERVNPYLLRYYFLASGKSEAWFLEQISAVGASSGAEQTRG